MWPFTKKRSVSFCLWFLIETASYKHPFDPLILSHCTSAQGWARTLSGFLRTTTTFRPLPFFSVLARTLCTWKVRFAILTLCSLVHGQACVLSALHIPFLKSAGWSQTSQTSSKRPVLRVTETLILKCRAVGMVGSIAANIRCFP